MKISTYTIPQILELKAFKDWYLCVCAGEDENCKMCDGRAIIHKYKDISLTEFEKDIADELKRTYA